MRNLQENQPNMKTERHPHHSPLHREDVAVKNEDDMVQCFERLTILPSRQHKINSIIKGETKNERQTSLNRNTDIKKETKTKEKEVQKITTKSQPNEEDVKGKEKSKVKEEEKPKEKEEPLGELCARGPDRKGLATQTRVTTNPYAVVHPQRNTSLANGGHIIYNLTETNPGFCCTPSICQPEDPALKYFTNNSAPYSNGHIQFANNITDYPHGVCESSDFHKPAPSPAKPEALSPGMPEGFNSAKSEVQCNLDDHTTIAMIQAVTSDPSSRDSLFQDLEECLQETINETNNHQNIPKTPLDHSPYSSYGSLSPASSPQVVPRSSPNSVCYGSPGPSSPNIPIFSPNIPSPRGGYISDESSNNMYPSSTPPMGKQAYYDPVINLDDICNGPPAGKRLEEKKLVQELDNSCSQACSTSEVVHQPSILPSSSVPVTTLLVPLTIKPTTSGTPRFRSIRPKPPQQSADNIKVQNIPTQPGCCNGIVSSPRKGVLTVKTTREMFSARCKDEKKKMTYFAKTNACTDAEVSMVDEDGDTNLIIIISNPKEYCPEKVFAMVERCREVPYVFSIKNKLGHSALFLASVIKCEDPLLAKYIAETMIDVGINMNEQDKDGSTIIHNICKEGDKCAKVLKELLSLRNEQGKQCFNVNKSDYEGMSPLHVAVKHHSEVSCLQIVTVLLEHGADVGIKDGKQGSTPLHFAVATDKPDLTIIKILCNAMVEKKDLVNMKNYKGDTPLHMAMAFGGCLEQNTHHGILDCLMVSGASRAIRNQNGKVPLELAPDSRKVGVCS